MIPLPVALILTALCAASMVGQDPDAVPVFHCDFSEPWDVNFDQWPDHWTRMQGREYPAYLEIAMRDEPSPAGNRCLRMDLDGGAAAALSPPIRIHPEFSYVLEGYLKTEKLTHNVAYYSVQFLDQQRKPLSRHASPPVRDANDWHLVRLGPMTPPSSDARFAQITVHLQPTEQADLEGAALFDDIWLARVPQMALHTGSPHNVYSTGDDLQITCHVSGVVQSDPLMRFELLDIAGQVVDAWETRLAAQPQAPIQWNEAERVGKLRELNSLPWTNRDLQQQTAYVGSACWQPTVPKNGFYWVRASLGGEQGAQRQQLISLVLIEPVAGRTRGEFGWSLPEGEHPLGVRDLGPLLSQAGISWVKFPVWFSDSEAERADRLTWFAERLSSDGIELIGMLDQPPEEVRTRFGGLERLPAAAVFAEPQVWSAVLDPVMTRLSLKVQWWQLGRDDDTSYVGYPDLSEKIQEVKSHLQRFGQSIRLGISWRWLYQLPAPSASPLDFLSLSEMPPLTGSELRDYLAAGSDSPVQRWSVLRPLARSHYDAQARARDLVLRMLAAKIGGAARIFLSDPFGVEHGVMNPDGTPGELLLPWRTSALMLSATEHLGSMVLPGGSQNEVLSRGEETIMVVWSDTPREEVAYLGPEVRQVDLWGRESVPEVRDGRHVIPVGWLPTFLTGLHPSVTRWRLSFQFDNQQISSVVGRPQTVSYHFTNHFAQGVSGHIRLDTPEVWGAQALPVPLKLAAGEQLANSFMVTLRPAASSGRQDVRIDFDITADQRYEFSVYRALEVGLGNVSLELRANINSTGQLVVQQTLTNQSEQLVSFNCYLFAPHRRRLRHQVFDLARGSDRRLYVMPDGAELKGETLWLRAEEIGGDRVLNYRLQVDE